MWSLKRFFVHWNSYGLVLLSGILMTWPIQCSWRRRIMDSVNGIQALELISEWVTLCHQRCPGINWRRLMWKDASSLIFRRHGTHVSQPYKMMGMTTASKIAIFVWIVIFGLPNTRLLRRRKADDARLMRLWISCERSPEYETYEPRYVIFSQLLNRFPLIEKNGSSGDDALKISDFVALIIWPARRYASDKK